MRKLDNDGIRMSLCHKGVEWYSNPPTVSHIRGAWERIIVCEVDFEGIVKEQLVDEDVLRKVAIEVGQILNYRPITANSVDSRDAEPLTPKHLFGESKSRWVFRELRQD
ncbi:hypothetical protein HOLleu_11126 [Holothuria leucospilota]|uniref:Uncharacterized protein n=1 Tax=Holothuria leucospilota TaxID=206669 RepID=A0A9Q1CE83_HOLLE|nr:hypothetical protein HOLleu_11126 [Holothuria leucospilota]